MLIGSILTKAARLYPEQIACIDGDVTLTYSALLTRVTALGHALQSAGVKRQDRICILHPNGHAVIEAYFAAAMLGAVLVPIHPKLSIPELQALLADCEPTVIIAYQQWQELLTSALSQTTQKPVIYWSPAAQGDSALPPNATFYEDCITQFQQASVLPIPSIEHTDIAQIYYTSGSTGQPKGVMLTHQNVTTHAMAAIAEFQLTEQDRWLHIAPLFHLADAWATFAITWVGGQHICLPKFQAKTTLAAIEKHGITLTNLIPTMLIGILNHRDISAYDLKSMRLLLTGGAAIAPNIVKRALEHFDCEYMQTYGMTESSPYLTISHIKPHLRHGTNAQLFDTMTSTGREFLPIELQVIDEHGQHVALDGQQIGQIIVRGDTITPGYWRQEALTQHAIRDGWLHTGDLATMDHERYIRIVGRDNDLIITGGENVYATEVEHCLSAHQAVAEVAVVGKAHAHWGEVVQAFVCLLPEQAEISSSELIHWCRQHLAAFKVPRHIAFSEALPRTATGKINKQVLRQQAATR